MSDGHWKVAYNDYGDPQVTRWCEWADETELQRVINFISSLEPAGGGGNLSTFFHWFESVHLQLQAAASSVL